MKPISADGETSPALDDQDGIMSALIKEDGVPSLDLYKKPCDHVAPLVRGDVIVESSTIDNGIQSALIVQDDIPSGLSTACEDVIMESFVVDGGTLPALEDHDGFTPTLIEEDGVPSHVSLMEPRDHVARLVRGDIIIESSAIENGIQSTLTSQDDIPTGLSAISEDVIMESFVIDGETPSALNDQDGISPTMIDEDDNPSSNLDDQDKN